MMASRVDKAARSRRVEDLGARVLAWDEKWASTYVEAYVSAANLMLDRGCPEGARLLHAELTRRFPSRIGAASFLDLDRRLGEVLHPLPETTPCKTQPRLTPSPLPCDEPSNDDDAIDL